MTAPPRCLRPLLLALLACWIGAAPGAWAAPIDQAKAMHDRLVGLPPTQGVLAQMTQAIVDGDPIGAAYIAMDQPSGAFYTSALRDWVTPWTNVEQTPFAPLNDYSATVIGIIRDDLPFTDVLTADLVYVGAPGVVASDYSHTDNDHYEELEAANVNLGDASLLVPTPQSGLPDSQLADVDTAGVITTRAAGQAFFSAGTNRRMFRFTSMNFLCRDLEDLSDVTRPVDRVRQDVNRSPGGDSEIYHNTCTGCHAGMDPLAGAFAYFEWDDDQGRVVHTPGEVQPKHRINANVFPGGFITLDNSWFNYWRSGVNANLGWSEALPGAGYGAQSFGAEIANSRAFAECQVEKVFERVCLRPPGNAADRAEVDRIATVFESGGHSMKEVFAEVAVSCTAP